MGIFFEPFDDRKHIFNEIEATRPQPRDQEDNTTTTTDYTEDDEDQGNNQGNQGGDNTPDNPADAPEDYTVPDKGEEQEPEEADQNAPEEGTEATGGDPVDNEQYGDEGGGNESGGSGENTGGEEGEDTEDYTDDEGGGDDDYGDDGADPSDDEIKQLEDEIFSNYSVEQIAIMNKDLKNDFNKLFLMLDDLVDHINDIPKVMEHIATIEFISNKLAELRDMVSDYMYSTYNTKSYTENKIAYNRFLVTVRQINAIISKIPSLKDPKHET